MKFIELSGLKGNGKFSIVDDDDYDFISLHRWHLGSNGYALTNTPRPYRKGQTHTIFMHRLIHKTPYGKWTDHKNGDRLDNRKENLRTATKSQNLCNMNKHSDNKVGFKGICFHSLSGLWNARIQINYQRKSLGYFVTKSEAARAYNRGAKKYHGVFAKLNHV